MHWTRTRKRIAALAVAIAMGAGATGAFAYFVAQGTGSTMSNVIVSGPPVGVWTVAAQANGMDTSLSPGNTEDTPSGGYEIAVGITNHGTSSMELNSVTATLTTDAAGGIYDVTSSAFVDACQASWFTVTAGGLTAWSPPPALPELVAPGVGLTYGISIKMPANSTTDQSSCERLSPQISVAVS